MPFNWPQVVDACFECDRAAQCARIAADVFSGDAGDGWRLGSGEQEPAFDDVGVSPYAIETQMLTDPGWFQALRHALEQWHVGHRIVNGPGKRLPDAVQQFGLRQYRN